MNIELVENSFKTTTDKKCSISKQGMVSSAFPQATKAGVEMLKKGGNAVDAACATALALGVCEPQASGIGGQSLAILHFEGKTIAVDGSSRAPSLAHNSFFEKRSHRFIGYKATTVPSTIATLGYLNEKYGRLDWSTIVKPSIRIAKRGYRITKLQNRLQEENLSNFFKVKSRSGAKYFLKDGEVPYDVGDLFVQEDLSDLLQHLSKYGHVSFYQGMIAKLIDKDMRINKGFLRNEDLAFIPEPIERKPISRRYRGIRVYTMPPPTAGDTMLLVLMMLGNLKKSFLRKRTSKSYHFVAETFRKALLYRTQRKFNPETYHQIDEKTHLSRSFSKSLSESIRDSIDPNLPLKESSDIEDTTHLSVMDGEGNAVGITQSIELVYGSKAAADGLGFLYNNYMSAYELENPSHPFYLRPNSIPWTSVSPSIIFYNHKPWIVLGSPGSARIFSVVSHFISRVIDGDNPIDIAMTRPRIHCSLDGKISLEADDSGIEIIKHLKKMGYKIDIKERFSFYLGAIHAVLKRQTGDGFQGVAEIRRDGTAEGLN
ncbi:MAG: gamma-glutamyltransferase [Nitrososphaeria archaeon]|nr:gamma-glutamyltransferase [Nitrosopumilaceae archaeon]NIP10043.1 gamma-glutamyltransferase [Nitrosopumilaceae archaeon]NIP91020.1 gamma-glutamyltransferase [Nitrososphaeria archaeon]NIS94839.1 gamma-glutamyltransferase [Nitrosopumilaceae archaeon]